MDADDKKELVAHLKQEKKPYSAYGYLEWEIVGDYFVNSLIALGKVMASSTFLYIVYHFVKEAIVVIGVPHILERVSQVHLMTNGLYDFVTENGSTLIGMPWEAPEKKKVVHHYNCPIEALGKKIKHQLELMVEALHTFVTKSLETREKIHEKIHHALDKIHEKIHHALEKIHEKIHHALYILVTDIGKDISELPSILETHAKDLVTKYCEFGPKRSTLYVILDPFLC